MNTEDYKDQIQQERLKLGLEDIVATEKESVEEALEEIKETVKEDTKPVKSDGYMNEEQYLKKHGSLDGFKSKDKFDADGSFFEKIAAQNKKIDELLEFNKQAMEAANLAKKAGYEQALRDIQLKKMDAIREADVDQVMVLEQKADAVNEQLKTYNDTQVSTAPVDSEIVKDFKSRHAGWLNSTSQEDAVMQAAAAAELHIIMKTNPNTSEEAAIQQIESELARRFPSRFKNENKSLPALNTQSTVGREETSLTSKLTQKQKDFLKQAKRYGSKLTEEEYAKQLELTGQI